MVFNMVTKIDTGSIKTTHVQPASQCSPRCVVIKVNRQAKPCYCCMGKPLKGYKDKIGKANTALAMLGTPMAGIPLHKHLPDRFY